MTGEVTELTGVPSSGKTQVSNGITDSFLHTLHASIHHFSPSSLFPSAVS